MSQEQPIQQKVAEVKQETKPEHKEEQKEEEKVEIEVEEALKQLPKEPVPSLPLHQQKTETKTENTISNEKPKDKKKQNKKQKEGNSLPLKVVLLKNNHQHHFEFSPNIHNFNLTNTIFNFDDESQYKLNSNFSEIKHLELLRQFLQKHSYQPSSIRIAKPLITDRMRDNVDPITYSVLGKYELDQNFQQAAKILQLAEYIGITQFKDAMYAAVGSPFVIPDSDQGIDQYKIKHGLTDLTVQQEDEIIKQYPHIFERINKDLLEGLNKQIDLSAAPSQGMI